MAQNAICQMINIMCRAVCSCKLGFNTTDYMGHGTKADMYFDNSRCLNYQPKLLHKGRIKAVGLVYRWNASAKRLGFSQNYLERWCSGVRGIRWQWQTDYVRRDYLRGQARASYCSISLSKWAMCRSWILVSKGTKRPSCPTSTRCRTFF